MLVDGHSVAFRAYHALPPTIRDAERQPAHALYGFMNILFRVVQDQEPTHLGVTFDRGRPFRAALFPAYKMHRPMGPEDLEPQVRKLRGLLRAFCIPIYEVDGFEADDLLATLVGQARRHRLQVDLLSGDLDILQLVGPNVRVVAPGKTFSVPVLYDVPRVVERFGVRPDQLRDYKALVGDAADGIPGVAGIGGKSATALLQRFETLDGVYAHLDDITTPRLRNALAAGRESALLSRDLVQLRDDAPVELDLEACRLGGHDRAAAIQAIRDLGFEALAARVPEF
jgi:DNA polymerase-1